MTGEYLLGTDDVELARLGLQHEIWAARTELLLERAGFAPGEAVLDLGARPGFTSFALAKRVGPKGRVVAVDTSDRFAGHLQARAAAEGFPQVRFHLGDVQELSLPETFDGALARWLFCFLPRPAEVVARVAGLLESGARFAIFDYFNYLAVGFQPPRSELDRGFQAVYRNVRDGGGDLDIGGKLPGMLVRQGFTIEALLPFCEIARPGTPFWRWFEAFHRSYFHKMVASGHLNQKEERAFAIALKDAAADPGSFFFTPPMIGIVARKT